MSALKNSGMRAPAVFRFLPAEIEEMEEVLQPLHNTQPGSDLVDELAKKFSASRDGAAMIPVTPKQVRNWFHNRRYSREGRIARGLKEPGTKRVSWADQERGAQAPGSMTSSLPYYHKQAAGSQFLTQPSAAEHAGASSGKNLGHQAMYEAKSTKDGAWYDVHDFLSHRLCESGDSEVNVKLSRFGADVTEWVNSRTCLRLRSLSCKPMDCVNILPGDPVLCFKESKESSLYFDAHVLDVQRERHDDVRGCHCKFLVRYEHNDSQEIVPLTKVCRRPETNYRLRISLVLSKGK